MGRQLGRVDATVATETAGGGHLGVGHRREGRLVDLHDPAVHAGEPPAQVGEVHPDALGERLRELATGTVVAQHLVAARLLDGRGEGPRPRHLRLERARAALGELLERVEVLRKERARPAVVDPAGVGQPPAGGLQVGGEPGRDREGATGHRRQDAPAGELGDVRQVGELAEHEAHGLGVGRVRRAGQGAHAGGGGHDMTTGRVDSMVAEPTTRVPS